MPPEQARDNSLVFMAVGDLLLGGPIQEQIDRLGYDHMLSGVARTLRSADLVLANLETPITIRGRPLKKYYVFSSAPAAAEALHKAGVTVVSLANNHTLDYGRQGLLDTLDILPKHGIQSFGAGRNEEEAYRPLIITKKGLTIGLIGYITFLAPGIPRDLARAHVAFPPKRADIIDCIEKLKKKVDVAIVCYHWGREFHSRANDLQRRYAQAAIDGGADLVLGHHPHVLQHSETYKGKTIVYSLGNFVFFMKPPKTRESTIFKCRLTKNGVKDIEHLPVSIRDNRPEIISKRS